MKIKTHQRIVNKSNKIYSKSALKFGLDSKAVLYDNRERQYIRFDGIIKELDLKYNKSLLDVGCGNAELYKYLDSIGYKGTYTGYDINSHLIELAKQRFKDIEVHELDILTK